MWNRHPWHAEPPKRSPQGGQGAPPSRQLREGDRPPSPRSVGGQGDPPGFRPHPPRRPHRSSDWRSPWGGALLELDPDLTAQLRLAAHTRDQSLEALIAEMLLQGLEREALRARAHSILQSLTPREREVAGLAARGRTNPQIAEVLVISPETVKTHVRHVLEKFGLRRKMDLRLLLLDLGIRWWSET